MAEEEIELKEDTGIWPVMTSLLGCLETEFAESGLGSIAYLAPLPGADVAIYIGSEDECVQVWIRLIESFVSVTFPEPNLAAGVQRPLAYHLEIGSTRCVPVGSEDAEGASPAEQLESTRYQMAEMAAMRRAICKCLEGASRKFVLGTYTPAGPLGGMVGGTWDVTVGTPK